MVIASSSCSFSLFYSNPRPSHAHKLTPCPMNTSLISPTTTPITQTTASTSSTMVMKMMLDSTEVSTSATVTASPMVGKEEPSSSSSSLVSRHPLFWNKPQMVLARHRMKGNHKSLIPQRKNTARIVKHGLQSKKLIHCRRRPAAATRKRQKHLARSSDEFAQVLAAIATTATTTTAATAVGH